MLATFSLVLLKTLCSSHHYEFEIWNFISTISIKSSGCFLIVSTLSVLPPDQVPISFKQNLPCQTFSLKTAGIHSKFPARQKISWEPSSQVPNENPVLGRL